jgi:hypothetical protein
MIDMALFEWYGSLMSSPFLSLPTGLFTSLLVIWFRNRFPQPKGSGPELMLVIYAIGTLFLTYQGFLTDGKPFLEAAFTLNDSGVLHSTASFFLFGVGMILGELVELRRVKYGLNVKQPRKLSSQ